MVKVGSKVLQVARAVIGKVKYLLSSAGKGIVGFVSKFSKTLGGKFKQLVEAIKGFVNRLWKRIAQGKKKTPKPVKDKKPKYKPDSSRKEKELRPAIALARSINEQSVQNKEENSPGLVSTLSIKGLHAILKNIPDKYLCPFYCGRYHIQIWIYGIFKTPDLFKMTAFSAVSSGVKTIVKSALSVVKGVNKYGTGIINSISRDFPAPGCSIKINSKQPTVFNTCNWTKL